MIHQVVAEVRECSSRPSWPSAASPSPLTDEAVEWLAEKGYDERMGARPLGRVIQEHIKKPLADEGPVRVSCAKGGTVRILVETKENRRDRAQSSRRWPNELPVRPKKEETRQAGCPQAPQEDGGEEAGRRGPGRSRRAAAATRRSGRIVPQLPRKGLIAKLPGNCMPGNVFSSVA